MSPKVLFVFAALAVGTGAITSGIVLWRRSAATRSADEARAVYICRETGELFVGRGDAAPQIHPASGRASLWPALYCPECDAWSPSPPTARLYGHAELLDCPKCRTARVFNGVIPDDATEF